MNTVDGTTPQPLAGARRKTVARLLRSRLFMGMAIGLFICGAVGPAIAGGWKQKEFSFAFGKPLKVMTRNLYVGTDLFAVLQPCAEDERPETIPPDYWASLCIPFKVAKAFQTIQFTDFTRRAEAIAAEIETHQPDLIGLQEVYLIRLESPGDFTDGNIDPDADRVVYDYLQLLIDALQARGLQYEAVAAFEGIDLEFPALIGFGGTGPLFDDVRITDRDVILARKNLAVTDAYSRAYEKMFVYNLMLPGDVPLPLEFKRGLCSVNARVRGATYRFVNTHLEIRGFPVYDAETGALQEAQRWQAEELMTELAGETLPTVLVGDFNSDPTDDAEVYAYPVMGQAGFVDVWNRRRHHPRPGLTCCRDELLADSEEELYERIDLVFVRNDLGVLDFSLIGPVQARLIGEDPIADTPPLYASDHAGVFARLKLPVLQWHR